MENVGINNPGQPYLFTINNILPLGYEYPVVGNPVSEFFATNSRTTAGTGTAGGGQVEFLVDGRSLIFTVYQTQPTGTGSIVTTSPIIYTWIKQ